MYPALPGAEAVYYRSRGKYPGALLKRPMWVNRWGKGKEEELGTRLTSYIHIAHRRITKVPEVN